MVARSKGSDHENPCPDYENIQLPNEHRHIQWASSRLGQRKFMNNKPSLFSAMWMGISTRFNHWSALPLRLIVGYGFMAHGYAKLARGPEHFAAILHAIGVPAPEIMAWANIGVELLGGFAVLIGAFVTLASIPMTIVLLVAILTVHLPYGFSSIKLLAVTRAGAQFGPPGYETDLLYIACLMALVLGGSGPLAIDGSKRQRTKNRPCHLSDGRS